MIKLTLATAKQLYQEGGAGKAFALDNYNETELTKPILPNTWEELNNIDGTFVEKESMLTSICDYNTTTWNKNIFATKEQAQASIAMAQLSQLMAVYNEGWTPDWTKENPKMCISINRDKIFTHTDTTHKKFLCFKTAKMRNIFAKNFFDLIIQAKPLL